MLPFEIAILITELGFAEPNRAAKIRRGLMTIIKDYPEIKGLINWGDEMTVHPNTPAAAAFKQVIDENPGSFHSRLRFSKARAE